MGFPKHYLFNPRRPPFWAATVGGMKDRGTDVKALCQSGCGFRADPLDLDLIMAVKGREFSLFDVRGVCPKCSAGVRFFFRPGGANGTPWRPCLT